MSTQFTGVIYVMGVSGCGKSTVAKAIAEHLGVPFCEADKLHPAANIKRMSKGVPLTDQDREPWLEKVSAEAKTLASHNNACVVACSSLKQAYRDILSTAHDKVYYVYLHGSYDLIFSRMSERTGHFMPDTLLQSQFDALEEPPANHWHIIVEIDQTPDEIATDAIELLRQRIGKPSS